MNLFPCRSLQNSARDRQLREKTNGWWRQARAMRLVGRQVRRPLADLSGRFRQVEHHEEQRKERGHDCRDVEDDKARY